MRTVGIVDLGENLSIKLPKLVKGLNRLQKTFRFSVLGARPELGPPHVEDIWHDVDSLFHQLESVHGAKGVNFIVAITHVRITLPTETQGLAEKDYFSQSDYRKLTVITEALADHISPHKSKYQYCAYLIAEGLLLNIAGADLGHAEVRYCLFDQCEDRAELGKCIDLGQICPQCEGELKRLQVDDQMLADIRKVLRWCKKDTLGSSVASALRMPLVTLVLGASVGWFSRNFIQNAYWPFVAAFAVVVLTFGFARSRWFRR